MAFCLSFTKCCFHKWILFRLKCIRGWMHFLISHLNMNISIPQRIRWWKSYNNTPKILVDKLDKNILSTIQCLRSMFVNLLSIRMEIISRGYFLVRKSSVLFFGACSITVRVYFQWWWLKTRSLINCPYTKRDIAVHSSWCTIHDFFNSLVHMEALPLFHGKNSCYKNRYCSLVHFNYLPPLKVPLLYIRLLERDTSFNPGQPPYG